MLMGFKPQLCHRTQGGTLPWLLRVPELCKRYCEGGMDKITGWSGLAESLAKSESAVSPGTKDCSGDPRSRAFLLHVTLGTLPNLDP